MMRRRIVLAIVALPFFFYQGNAQEAPKGWHLMDLAKIHFMASV